MKRFLVAAACAGVLAMTGCGAPTPLPSESAAPATVTPAAAAQPTPPTTQAATPTTPAVAAFGDTVKLPSGLSFTLTYEGTKPATKYTESGKYSGKTAVFKLTVQNGTKQPVDASTFLPAMSATAGTDGHQVAGNGWDGYTWPKLGTVLPGETQSMERGYDAASAAGGLRVTVDVPRYLGGGTIPVVWKGDIK